MACALINQPLGCSHYKRKCKLVSPCCQKVYTCRLCHDEVENHTMNRKGVKEIVCMVCNCRQKVQKFCKKCKTLFGEYTCLVCNLFDNEHKGQFHCQGCGICRVGGVDNFFHCPKCDLCLNLRYLGAHQCMESRSHTDCPVCLEDIHNSRIELQIPKCGHLLHKPCFEKMENAGYTACPVCKNSFK